MMPLYTLRQLKFGNCGDGCVCAQCVWLLWLLLLSLFVSGADSCFSSSPPPPPPRPPPTQEYKPQQSKEPLNPNSETPVIIKPAAELPLKREKKCDFADIKINAADDLLAELKGKVHGQQVAVDTIAASIRGHLVKRSPPKALVLSLHGPTGVGKTFVSEIIARSIYVNGTKSAFVQKISLAKSYIDASRIGEYTTDLRDRIVSTLKRCARSLFIIEEFDTNDVIANELSKVIKLFVEHGDEPFDGVDNKKAIFIFISNQGSSQILDEAVKLVKSDGQWQCFSDALFSLDHCFTGYQVEDKVAAMQERIHKSIKQLARHNIGYHLLAETDLITQFVCFIPLRKEHVELCVRDVLFRGNLPRFMLAKEQMSGVFNELEWLPDGKQVYSRSGCKRVEEIVNRMLGSEKTDHALQVEL